VVLTNIDIANSVVERIADAALRLMLAANEGAELPVMRETTPVPAALAARLEGVYGDGTMEIEIVDRAEGLYLTNAAGGLRGTLRMLGDTLITDDRLTHGTRILPLDADRVRIGDRVLERRPRARPAPPPARWLGLIGEYGWDHNTLYILERGGRLYSLIEWFFLDPLEEVERDVFAFPDRGLYPGERLIFTRDETGRATRVEAASVVFPRRPLGAEGGETFRIEPVRPVDELIENALRATPPVEQGVFKEPDLVDLATLDPTLRFDVRYATTNNFMGAVVYSQAKAFLQRPAAEAVVRANRRLAEHGYGLLIHDAYRPWYVTKVFWDATPPEMKHFVADPSQGSRHNRGAAVDLTMYDLRTGEVIETVAGYDEFSPRSYPDYPGGTSLQRWNRELLRDVMEAEGFSVYEWEWWHFDYDDWRDYPIGTATFDRIR
jgi:D-alanyl-D-alanine dipeptidase